MPTLLQRLLLLVLLGLAILEDLSGQVIADNTDLIVLVALERLVGNWVDVKGRIRWLASQLTKLLAKDLLSIVVQVILCTEEDNTTLGN